MPALEHPIPYAIFDPAEYDPADPDLSKWIWLDIHPVPDPTVVYERHVSRKKMLNAWSGTAITPGRQIVFDGGGHAYTDGTLELQVAFATEATKLAIEALYATTSTVYYTPDAGTTILELAWQGGQSFLPVRHPGLPEYQVTMKFYVIDDVSPP